MKKTAIIFIFFTLVFLSADLVHAQKTDSSLTAQYQSQKIHLHIDKDMYLPGETIWFKVYLFNKGIPDSITTNVYVSLLNERGGPVVQKLVPMIDAVGDGTIALPDSISANMLTRWSGIRRGR